jgi:hypothetical protein
MGNTTIASAHAGAVGVGPDIRPAVASLKHRRLAGYSRMLKE